jgi:hypothetical protein
LGGSSDAAACEAGGGGACDDTCDDASELAASEGAPDDDASADDAFDGASEACEDGASEVCDDGASEDGSVLAIEELASSETSSLEVTMSTLTAGGGVGSPTGSLGRRSTRKIARCTPADASTVHPI